MEFSVQQIAQLLGGSVQGDGSAKIRNIAKIQEGKEGDVSFLSNLKYEDFLYTTQATAVIVSEGFSPKKEYSTTLVVVPDAYAAFTALLTEYQRMVTPVKVGIEQPSFISDSATLGEEAYVGAFAYIGAHVRIGKNCKIYPHVYIGDHTVIGDNCTLYAGAKVYHGCKIGNHCTLQAGAVVGSDGFGFAPQADGSYATIPQLGNVVLEDHVDIGANAVVDRATMGSTHIGKGVKIDNLVQIAHNVTVGQHTVMAAQTGIAGSSSVGERCVFAGQVGIAGHLKIGDRVTLGAQSGIMHNVPDGQTWLGYPAQERTPFMRSTALVRKLPDLQKRVDELEKKVVSLQPKV